LTIVLLRMRRTCESGLGITDANGTLRGWVKASLILY